MCVFVTLVKSAVKNKYSLVENQSTDEKKFSNDNKLTVSLNDILTSGVYLVTLKEAGQAHTYKLIKQ